MTGTPAAEDVARRLRALLAAGGWSAGERMGDERTLAAALGVPRSRLRAGLEVLEAERAVRRTIGRAGGVFVSDGRIERHLNTTESLPEIARHQGVVVETRVLRATLGLADPAERRRLRLADGAPVHRLLRLRLADGRPLSVEATSLPADLFPGLDRQDLTSLYRTLREVYGTGPALSDESLEVVAAAEPQAGLLDVPAGTPLLRVGRVAAGADGRPIELGEETFVAERMRFHLRRFGHTRTDRPTGPAPPPPDAPARVLVASTPATRTLATRSPAPSPGGRP